MADIKELARKAASKLKNREARCEAEAIRKAITGSGITHKADVTRLMREVGTQYARDKRDESKVTARSSH